MNKSKKVAFNTALGGIVAALSVVIMFLTNVIPALTYALPAAAGVLITVIVVEVNKKWALGVYVVVSFLSFLLVQDKEAFTMYLLFFGYYPIIKNIFENKLSKFVGFILKMIIFNIGVIAAVALSTYIFNIPFEELEKYGYIAAIGLLAVGNVVFVIYDYALTNLIKLYYMKWQKDLKKIFKA